VKYIPAHGVAERSHGDSVEIEERAESLMYAVGVHSSQATWIRLSALVDLWVMRPRASRCFTLGLNMY